MSCGKGCKEQKGTGRKNGAPLAPIAELQDFKGQQVSPGDAVMYYNEDAHSLQYACMDEQCAGVYSPRTYTLDDKKTQVHTFKHEPKINRAALVKVDPADLPQDLRERMDELSQFSALQTTFTKQDYEAIRKSLADVGLTVLDANNKKVPFNEEKDGLYAFQIHPPTPKTLTATAVIRSYRPKQRNGIATWRSEFAATSQLILTHDVNIEQVKAVLDQAGFDSEVSDVEYSWNYEQQHREGFYTIRLIPKDKEKRLSELKIRTADLQTRISSLLTNNRVDEAFELHLMRSDKETFDSIPAFSDEMQTFLEYKERHETVTVEYLGEQIAESKFSSDQKRKLKRELIEMNFGECEYDW